MNHAFPLAVTGISQRLPEITGLGELRTTFLQGSNNRQPVTGERLHEDHVPWERRLKDADHFDTAFFGLHRAQATLVDPQQRLMAETIFNALENAGAGNRRQVCGLITSVSISSYLNEHLLPSLDRRRPDEVSRAILLNDKDNVAQHLGYLLGLGGPLHNRQAACASSALAIEQAWLDLRDGRCGTVVVAAASINCARERGHTRRTGVFSADGHCRAFSRKADGTASGDGVIAIVLRPLKTAVAEGDTVWACLRGVAIVNSASDRSDFLAPDSRSYATAMRAALTAADIRPEQVGLIEGHGTGIPWQDAAELEAISQVYGTAHATNGTQCALGSAKAQLGHLDAAASLAGLVRGIFALNEKLIFPTPFADESLPLQPGLRLPDIAKPLTSRFLGLNTFAANGTNAHLILEAAPSNVAPRHDTKKGPTKNLTSELCMLTAPDPDRLRIRAKRLAASLRELPSTVPLSDIAFSLGTGHRSFTSSFTAVTDSTEDLITALEHFSSTAETTRPSPSQNAPALFFLFPGMGDLADDMIPQFADRFPAVRETLMQCAEACLSATGVDLASLLFPPLKPDTQTGTRFRDWIKAARAGAKLQSRYEHLRLFSFEYALTRLLLDIGLAPRALIGYSTGEYVASCLSSCLTLEECFQLLHRRIELLDQAEAGALTAVPLAADELEKRLPPGLAISARQGDFYNIVGGAIQAVERFEMEMEAEDIACRRLAVTHAFHTPLMEPLLEDFREITRTVPARVPTVPFISTLTGQPAELGRPLGSDHWARHMRDAVRIDDAITSAFAMADPGEPVFFLEIGPGQHLSGLLQRHPRKTSSTAVHATTALPVSEQNHAHVFLEGLASCIAATSKASLGKKSASPQLDLRPLFSGHNRRRVSLEASPFIAHPL